MDQSIFLKTCDFHSLNGLLCFNNDQTSLLAQILLALYIFFRFNFMRVSMLWRMFLFGPLSNYRAKHVHIDLLDAIQMLALDIREISLLQIDQAKFIIESEYQLVIIDPNYLARVNQLFFDRNVHQIIQESVCLWHLVILVLRLRLECGL